MNIIKEKKLLFSPLDIAQMGMMVAIIEVSKFALAPFPNIELTSFWLIMFTLFMGRRIIAVVPAFILIEGAVYVPPADAHGFCKETCRFRVQNPAQ